MSSLLPDEGEHLSTGWEPDLEVGDSLVRRAVFAHASWAVAQAQCIDRPWIDSAGWAGGFCHERGHMNNWVVLKQPSLDLRPVFAEIEQLFPAGVPFLLVSAWPTADLRPFGVGLVGHPPLMWRPPVPGSEPPATDLDVHAVTGSDELIEAERVLVDGYPLAELQPFEPGCVYSAALLDDAATRPFIAYGGDTPLATACAHSAHGVTLVESVAVMPAARGRGAGAAVTWAATTAFAGQPAVLLASDDGQPVYARLGFERLERWTVWMRPS